MCVCVCVCVCGCVYVDVCVFSSLSRPRALTLSPSLRACPFVVALGRLSDPISLVVSCIIFCNVFEGSIRVFGYRYSLFNGARLFEVRRQASGFALRCCCCSVRGPSLRWSDMRCRRLGRQRTSSLCSSSSSRTYSTSLPRTSTRPRPRATRCCTATATASSARINPAHLLSSQPRR